MTSTSEASPPATSPVTSTTPKLTRREGEVLTLIAAGLSNREIGEQLYVSVNSVKTHVRSAYRKIGVSRRVDAVRWVLLHDAVEER